MMVTFFEKFAKRRKPRGWLSHVIVMSGLASNSIMLVKPAMFWLLDSFTAVGELKNAVQEAWRFMVLGAVFISMKFYYCRWLRRQEDVVAMTRDCCTTFFQRVRDFVALR